MEIINRQVEKIEKKGKPIVLGVKTCKTFRKALQTLIGQNYKKKNIEIEFYIRGLLDLYNKFHPEKNVETNLPKLKGKSSIEIIKEIDKWTITTYQKDDEGNPRPQKVVAYKEQIVAMVDVIKDLSNKMDWIPTRILAPKFLLKLGITKTPKGKNLFVKEYETWDLLYSWRSMHNLITRILDAFRDEGIIEYTRSGKTKLLKDKFSIQEILN